MCIYLSDEVYRHLRGEVTAERLVQLELRRGEDS